MAVNLNKIKKMPAFYTCREVFTEMANQINVLEETVNKQAGVIKKLGKNNKKNSGKQKQRSGGVIL